MGLKRSTLSDLYYFLIASRWRVVLLIYGGGYLLTNALFALVYTWTGGVTNVRPGSYSDAFFFSAETLGTIGYGVFAPQSFAAHSVATVENMVGLLFLATFTGITFAKFSRPRARVIFSDVAVVGVRNGKPTLSFRVANERVNHVVAATLRVTLVRSDVTREGERYRRMVDMPLVRSESPAFVLTWLALHVIDETSPLHGRDGGGVHRRDDGDPGDLHRVGRDAGPDHLRAAVVRGGRAPLEPPLPGRHPARRRTGHARSTTRRFHETEAVSA